jgi:hypothetical protein
LGGLPRLADREAFCQAFTVLRYLLHHPYAQGEGERINEHIASSLTRECGGRRRWQARQVHTAISETLTPYGFRRPGRSGRRGFALGTALLSLQQLQQACRLLQLQADDLGDRSAAALSSSLRERLQQVGADPDQLPAGRRWIQPHRPRQSIRQARCTAAGECLLEATIQQRQKLLIAQPSTPRGPAGAAPPATGAARPLDTSTAKSGRSPSSVSKASSKKTDSVALSHAAGGRARRFSVGLPRSTRSGAARPTAAETTRPASSMVMILTQLITMTSTRGRPLRSIIRHWAAG